MTVTPSPACSSTADRSTPVSTCVKGADELRDFADFVPTHGAGRAPPRQQRLDRRRRHDATARLYLQMWSTAGGAAETKLVISGRYEDTLRRDDGTWRFVTRKMVPDG